jgi:hypothetical protein
LTSVKKELQQEKTNNAVLARYINAKRKKEETRKKVEEQQNSKGLFPPAS